MVLNNLNYKIPVFLDDFELNKSLSEKASKLFSKTFIPNTIIHGPPGSGKFHLARCILNTIHNKEILLNKKLFKIGTKELYINTSNYHFEICIDKYNFNKSILIELIEYLTEGKDINFDTQLKIIFIRNLNYVNNDFLVYLKNKIELSSDNYRFIITTNNLSTISKKYFGLFTFLRIPYNSKENIKKYLINNSKNNENNEKTIKKILEKTQNLNEIFLLLELNNSSTYKSTEYYSEKKILKHIKESIDKPDNILEIRNELYNLNIKNIKLLPIFKSILYKFLGSSDISDEKKYKMIDCFSKYNSREVCSYKQQIHYEALIMEINIIYHDK